MSSASELDIEPLGDWDFDRDYLDCVMMKAVELEQGRREQQRQRMVLYRRKKKEVMTSLHQERQRLEEVFREQIARMRIADIITIKTTRYKEKAVHQVVLEHAQLARENFVLRQSVDECRNHRKTIEQAYLEFCRHLQDDPLPSENIPLPREKGWYVYFPDNSPSFYFQPLSRKEFDSGRVLHVGTSPCFSTVGNIFGWTVDYAPVTRNQSDTAFMAYARFSRRIRCNIDDAASILLSTDSNFWPVIVSARSWGLEQHDRHRYVVLQQLDDSSHVVVCNIPGNINLRYIAATRYSREKRPDGKQVHTCSVSITDSKKNALLREMEGQQQNVQWIQEGACIATFTEVDDTTIDVVCDHWAGCLSDAHGHQLYVDWSRYTVGLEQTISTSRLLQN